jgi:hypothetical protein
MAQIPTVSAQIALLLLNKDDCFTPPRLSSGDYLFCAVSLSWEAYRLSGLVGHCLSMEI